jgi:hypothetical protein
MTQPSAQRFIMENRFLANNTTINNSIDNEIQNRQTGDSTTLADSKTYTDSANAGNMAILVSSSGTRNYVLNGGFDIWQRGTTFTGTGGFGPDRWYVQPTSSSTWSQDPVLVMPDSPYSLKMTAGASGAQFYAYQIIETLNVTPLIGNNVMLSAYVSCSINATVRVGIEWSSTVDAGMGATWTMANSDTIVATSAYYQRVYVDVPIPLTARSLRIVISTDSVMTVGSTFNIADVQIENGLTLPTNFHRQNESYQTELAACRRYYYRTPVPAVGHPWTMGYNTTTLLSTHFLTFPVPMRIAPVALEQSGTAAHFAITNTAGAAVACTAVPTHVSASTRGARIATTVTTAVVAGQGTMLLANNIAGYLGWSAEL